MEKLFLGLLFFCIFMVLQSVFINGLKSTFGKEMIFEKVGIFLKSKLPIYLYKPLIGCVQCMSSVWGTITYWSFIFLFFKLKYVHIPIWVAIWVVDVFCLTVINLYISKKL